MHPNPQKSMRTSNIPGLAQQSTVRASLPAPSSYQAADHPTGRHPRVSAANTARPSRIPAPPERAPPPSADACRLDAAPSSRLSTPSFAGSQVMSNAMPAQKNTAASAQPAASAEPALEPNRPLSLRKSLLAPASGATANHEVSVSAAQAPACKAPAQACPSAQINMTASPTTVGEAASTVHFVELSAAAAAAYGLPAACGGKVLPVLRTLAEVTDSVNKDAALPAHPAISAVAKRTRAASSQQVLSSPPKPVTSRPSSAVPASSPAPGDSAACDSDSSSDDETDSPNNGAAAVSQKLSEVPVSQPESAPMMLANPLYTRRCTISGRSAGMLTHTTLSLV